MILGYKQYFPFNGEWTNFEHKILAGFPSGYSMVIGKSYCSGLPINQQLSYMNLFLDNIANADPKLHSIREDKHNRWKPGMIIHHSFGIRTKKYRCFAKSKCVAVQNISILVMSQICVENCHTVTEYIPRLNETFYKTFKILIDGRELSDKEIGVLAKNDGFDSTDDFFRWFDKPFKGKIIHWTDLKY